MRMAKVPIAARFVLGYLAVSAMVSALLIGHLVSDTSAQLTHEVSKKGDAVTRLFARSLVNPLYQLDVEWMENAIGHVQGLEDVREVVVFNERAQVVTDGTVANPRLGDPVPDAADVMASRAARPRMESETARLRFMIPVTLGDQILGGVRLDLSLENARAKVMRLRSELVLFAAVVIVLGALPVWLATHFLIKPLIFGDA